ncbi:MAG TPA: SRPBCC family protein [Pyrinomonadaceae bacterium]|nr:SRPBCC family protein [Pyrinomonadaceae bacterium]
MRFVKESVIRAAPERVFAFHEQPDALEQLTPPWEATRVIEQGRISEVGSRTVIETKVFGPIKARWISEHTVYDPPRLFEDVQVKGPFKSWRHQHIVEPHTEGALLRDEIEFEPPMGIFGRLAAPFFVIARLEKLFNYRHEATRRWSEGRSEEG